MTFGGLPEIIWRRLTEVVEVPSVLPGQSRPLDHDRSARVRTSANALVLLASHAQELAGSEPNPGRAADWADLSASFGKGFILCRWLRRRWAG